MSKLLPRAVALLLLATLASGCSSSQWMRPSECALIGTGLGSLGGVAWAATEDDADFEDWALGIGVGAAGGALLGYALCSVAGAGN